MERVCPLCGGIMLRGRTKQEGYARYFWKEPWRKGLSKLGGGVNPYPWLCLSCGAVIPYVEGRDLERIKREYEREKMRGFRD